MKIETIQDVDDNYENLQILVDMIEKISTDVKVLDRVLKDIMKENKEFPGD